MNIYLPRQQLFCVLVKNFAVHWQDFLRRQSFLLSTASQPLPQIFLPSVLTKNC